MKIFYLNDNWPWFGEHQCYGRLVHYVRAQNKDTHEVAIQYGLKNRLAGKIYSVLSGRPSRRDSVFADAEWRYGLRARSFKDKNAFYHVLFFDNHYQMFESLRSGLPRLIATIHHPPARPMTAEMTASLRGVSALVVMFKEGVPFFEKYTGKGKVKFIHHGVDTDFFQPALKKNETDIKNLFFTGQNGRDLNMLKRVFLKLIEKNHRIRLILLVPKEFRKSRELAALADHEAVEWHSQMSEEKVREVYQKSYLLLLPLIDSGVNNAIVEALACGLPPVTTDVGGVRDYGGGDIYPLAAKDDDNGMVRIIEKYLADEAYRQDTALQCRRFAERDLAWPVIAQRYIQFYDELKDEKK